MNLQKEKKTFNIQQEVSITIKINLARLDTIIDIIRLDKLILPICINHKLLS